MRAGSPSVTVKVRLTRLRSIGVTVVTTSAPYRLRLMYWRLSSCSARSARRLVVGTAFGQADLAQRLLQRVLVEFLGADEVDVGHRGTLLDDHHQHVAADLEAHVLEQAQAEQRADGGRALLVVVLVADAKGQRGEDGAGLHALQAFDPDVAHREGVHRPGIGHEGHGDHGRNGTHAKAL